MHYADTYALIEILRGNPNYKPYKTLITSEFNLLELAYALTRDYNEGKSKRSTRKSKERTHNNTPNRRRLHRRSKIQARTEEKRSERILNRRPRLHPST